MSSHSAGHDGHEHNELAHVAPVKILLGTFGVLMVLTIVTVLATKVDFGSSINLAVAMAIATVKATLVALYFMHLRYDKVFHTVAIASGILAALLFVGFTLLDHGAYLPDLIWDEPPRNP